MSPKANKSPAEGERRKTAMSENSLKKPTRPLTSYHLFFQLEREYILQTTPATGDPNDDSARPQVDDRPIGKEIDPAMPYRYRYVRLSPTWYASGSGKRTGGEVKKRKHRRTHGKIGFLDLSKRIAERWAGLEEDDRAAKEYVTRIAGRELEAYRRAVKEHKGKDTASADWKADSMDADEMKLWIERAASRDGTPAESAPAVVSANNPTTIDATVKAEASESSSVRSCGRGHRDSFEPLAFDAAMNPAANVAPADATKSGRPSYERRVATATELDLCDESLFEPLPVERATRWVSTDISPLLDGSGRTGDAVNTPMAVMMANGSAGSDSTNADLERLKTSLALHQMFLRNSIKSLQDKIIQNNALLLSDMRMFPKEEIVPREIIVGEKPYLEILTSSRTPTPSSNDAAGDNANLGGGSNGPAKGEVSAQDSMEFIDELDEAIDDHGICSGSGPSFLFGKPAFHVPGPDFGDKPASPPQTTVPMPAGIRLKNDRARMA